jgi:hypothetical protein
MECVLWAVVALTLAAASVIFGLNLLPSAEDVAYRLGTAFPLYLTWGMIGIITVTAVVLATFLLTQRTKDGL